MSERNTSVPTTQVVPTVEAPAGTEALQAVIAATERAIAERNPEPPPAQTPEAGTAAVSEQAAIAVQLAADEEAKARTEAQATLKAVVSTFRKGEKAYKTGLLETGRLADQYVHQRLLLGDKRAAAVQAIEGQLAQYASTTVDVNRLIACYHAYHLLAELPAVKDADQVPYGHYREAWIHLVYRQAKDTPQEQWVLLDGLEQDCRNTFAKAVAGSLSREASAEQTKSLLRRHAEAELERSREAASAAKTAEETKRKQAVNAEITMRVAAETARKVQIAAETAPADRKAELTAEAEQAQAKLQASQQALIQSLAATEEAARIRAKAERDAGEKTKAAEKSTAKAQAKQQPTTERPKLGNLLKPKTETVDVEHIAAMAAEYITDTAVPDDVFVALLRKLKTSGQLCKQSMRAIDAALVVLERKGTELPPKVADRVQPALPGPSSNGHTVAA